MQNPHKLFMADNPLAFLFAARRGGPRATEAPSDFSTRVSRLVHCHHKNLSGASTVSGFVSGNSKRVIKNSAELELISLVFTGLYAIFLMSESVTQTVPICG
jgi:hypothetical protein